MKRLREKAIATVTLAAVMLSCGCGTLIPKRVELFQKKVQALPDKSERQREMERQAAAVVVDHATAAMGAARIGNMYRAQVELKDVLAAGSGLVTSLGPPFTGWDADIQALAVQMQREVSRLNGKLEDYRSRVEPLEGKKIEGTGLIQVPYLLWAGGFVVLLVVGFVVLKILLTALQMSNPGVALGLNIARVGGSAASQMLSQVLKGGREFKAGLDQIVEDPAVRQKVLDWFSAAHDKAQDESTRAVVKTLVK